MTGNEDSKFGFNLDNYQADNAFERLKNHPSIHLIGLHSHIGSQIFSEKSFLLAVDALFGLVQKWNLSDDFIPKVMNFGGDRKSTRLNSSHVAISYAVVCLRKKV